MVAPYCNQPSHHAAADARLTPRPAARRPPGSNAHLDTAYGGYCVFAQVEDAASFAVVDAIAAAIKAGGEGSTVAISGAALF